MKCECDSDVFLYYFCIFTVHWSCVDHSPVVVYCHFIDSYWQAGPLMSLKRAIDAAVLFNILHVHLL